MSSAERFVAAAYVVFVFVLLAYVFIQSRKLAQFERQIDELERRAA
jgi:hypothetical protein